MMGAAARTVAAGLILIVLAACSTTQQAQPTQRFIAWSKRGDGAKRLCVLPFEDRTGRPERGVAELVRRSVAGHLSVKRYADAELHEIDAYLHPLRARWKAIPTRELGAALECDALVYGRVTKAERLYLGVYSQVTFAGTIQLVDAPSGQTLVHDSYTTRFHAGSLPLSPIAMAASALMTLHNMTETQMERAIDDLGRHLAALVPEDPSVDLSFADRERATWDEREPAAETATQPGERYRLHVAGFRSHNEAQAAARLLREEGFHPAIAEVHDLGHLSHEVVLGPFRSEQAASRAGIRIQQTLPFVPIVTPAPRPYEKVDEVVVGASK